MLNITTFVVPFSGRNYLLCFFICHFTARYLS
jgi:hypothetical protein